MKNPNLDLKNFKPLIKKYFQLLRRHVAFAAIIVVLLAYVFVVWRISSLAKAEPSADAVTAAEATTTIPKVDKNAISQIQALEQNSSELHSLFDQARNNPFQE